MKRQIFEHLTQYGAVEVGFDPRSFGVSGLPESLHNESSVTMVMRVAVQTSAGGIKAPLHVDDKVFQVSIPWTAVFYVAPDVKDAGFRSMWPRPPEPKQPVRTKSSEGETQPSATQYLN